MSLTNIAEHKETDKETYYKNVFFSEWFEPDLNSEDGRVDSVVHEVNNTYRIATVPNQLRALRLVLLNLLHVAKQSSEMWLAYSRDRNEYTHIARYRTVRIGYRPMIEAVVDRLIGANLVDDLPGYHHRGGDGNSRVSRMRTSDSLRSVFAKHNAYNVKFEKQQPKEIILKKDAEKRFVDYADTAETNRWRDELATYNDFISATDLRIANTPVPVQFRGLVRIFNNNSFSQGGRFYRGWWQNMESEYRPFISINGKQTVEIDFSGLHIRMLYAKLGIDYQDDPYIIDGVAKNSPQRKMLKTALLTMLNANSERSALLSIQNEISEQSDIQPKPSYQELKSLISRFCVHHKPLKDAE
ncbi:hypothetical protein [Noviherbaspirillum sp. Root189]|uniref:hypothetical protein n=1 Tax=Noviherbaspirillum sp. Root189 TaxID=1736487 RepID=UPI000708966C|nr:hypothetical protein [Noviherbaspirillum sp. Root189]KRB79935.1 hypothetical protein ASE07_25160 [Noviherbaspirillum sp. Root189]